MWRRTNRNWQQRFRPRTPAAVLLALGTALGLWTSLHGAFASWPVDSDLADTVMLWHGVRAHGLGFLRGWVWAQDNWLLSLLPWSAALYALAGPRPALVVGTGWAVFVACAALAAWLGWRLARRPAVWALLPVLLLASRPGLGRIGWLAYPVTHTVTLLWGLLALHAAVGWMTARRPWALAAVAAALLIATISDPWALPALVLPVLLAAVLLRQGRLAVTVLVVGALAASRLGGVLDFLPPPRFEAASWAHMRENFALLPRILGADFAIWLPGAAAGEAAVMLPALLALDVAHAALRAWRGLAPPQRFGLLVCGLSVILTLAAFLGNGFLRGTGSGRFLVAVAFLLPLGLALGLACAWRRVTRAGRALAIVLAVLHMAAGAADAWPRHRLRADTEMPLALAGFLAAHGLHYGYGAYFGAQANAVTWLSGWGVVMRPVSFGFLDGRLLYPLVETSQRWYAPDDAPPGLSRRFVIVDPRSCASRDVCVTGLARQFGTPAQTLTFGGFTILVWDHALL